MNMRTADPSIDPGVSARLAAISKLMNPQSIMLVGMSTREDSAGRKILKNIMANGFAGELHLVGRKPGEADGIPIVTEISSVPRGVDLAVIVLPADAVAEAIRQCIAHGVGTAVVLASGFAETGGAGVARQAEVMALIRESDLAAMGPNCQGYTNHHNGLVINFTGVARVTPLAPDTRGAVAIVAQSGGIGSHLRTALNARGVPVSYLISTGNEMNLQLVDFIRYALRDEATTAVAVYVEEIRDAAAFNAVAREARQCNKAIVLLHPGSSAGAQEAAVSHTGALIGSHEATRYFCERAGVAFVETLDELLDVSEIFARYPAATKGGLGVLTFSGAYCGLVHDMCEKLGTRIPDLSAATKKALSEHLPDFLSPRNPLDLGTQVIFEPELVKTGLDALFEEADIGAVVVSITRGSEKMSVEFLKHVTEAARGRGKPLVLSMLGGEAPLSDEFLRVSAREKVIVSNSSDRTVRAMARVLSYGNWTAPGVIDHPMEIAKKSLVVQPGVQAEWRGKAVLRGIGIATPEGELATSLAEAQEIAKRIGYPVAMKAQASELAHKTEVGGVILNLMNSSDVERGWNDLNENVARHAPHVKLEGVLVEKIARPGVELVIGARRDRLWGPVIVLGLGGIYIELFKDTRIVAPDAPVDEIMGELDQLKAAKLLTGFRGRAVVDKRAVAAAASALGQLILSDPQIEEIEINPLIAYPDGAGVVALDALLITR